MGVVCGGGVCRQGAGGVLTDGDMVTVEVRHCERKDP